MASTGSISFGGLASGLDTTQLIENLMTVESKPLTRLENKKTELDSQYDTYTTMKSNLNELKTLVSALKSSDTFGVFSASSSDEEALTLSASTSANEGTYSIKILSLAQAETLSSNSYAYTENNLNLTGEILINGNSFSVSSTDSLIDIRNGINALDAGVTANILKVSNGDNRLIISSDTAGEEGIFIANVGSTDILGNLGFTDGTKSIREFSNGSVLSASFESSTATVGSLFDISSGVSGNVAIRDESLSIDLSKDTLNSIRDKINNLGLTGVTASIESQTENNATTYRLAITGTEDFTDDNNILETLGIFEGGRSGISKTVETGVLYSNNSENSVKYADSNTHLSQLGAEVQGGETETITISGTNLDGSAVSKTIEISSNTNIDDILTGIEEAYSGNVTASIENGKIQVKSNETGSSSLEFRIFAHNENGGTLDFGTISTTANGRERLLAEGGNARILVNNIEVSRDSNEVNDVLTGLNLTLKKADQDTTLSITVERNTDEIKDKIQEFITVYNEFIDFVDENSQYNEEENVAGPLLGDLTTRSILSRIRESLRTSVFGDDLSYNQLVQIGIESTADGKLELDTAKLMDAMDENVDSVVSLFSATRKSSDNDISFVYHSEKTKSGTYAVTITQAAEQAEVISDVSQEDIQSGTLKITDNFGYTIEFGYDSGMTFDDIANALAVEAQTSYSEILRSDTGLSQSANQDPVTQNTAISEIAGVQINENDTITINGTSRSGKEYQRIISLGGSENVTMQDILDAVEAIADNEVNATIDTGGKILIEDTQTGTNKFSFSIETTVEGLDFGTISSIQKGRNRVNIEASVTENNRLRINHSSYGSNNTLTISGGSGLGLADGEYAGVDVAGTINGVTGTGSGQSLSASASDTNARGIVIRTKITPEELAFEGPSQGTITLISGIADLLYSDLNAITNPVDGFIQAKIDSVELSRESVATQIDNTTARLDQRRQMYVKKFTELERAMASLESMQQSLSASLSALPSASLFS
ncbi:MAG: flagellar filament capping protein FliD [Candidatus Latescibacteria bacterium]|nr:flagellar filament capping protein FliD [Candidatus Latescibacterota bacterium]